MQRIPRGEARPTVGAAGKAAAFRTRSGVRRTPFVTAWGLLAVTLAAIDGAPADAGQRPRVPGSEVRPPLALEATGNRPRPPGHGPHPRPFSRPPRGAVSDLLSDRMDGRAYAAQTAACEPGAADVQSGQAPVAYLLSLPDSDCFDPFFDGPEDLRRTAFRDEHVRYVMDVAADLTRTYDGTDSRNLKELFGPPIDGTSRNAAAVYRSLWYDRYRSRLRPISPGSMAALELRR